MIFYHTIVYAWVLLFAYSKNIYYKQMSYVSETFFAPLIFCPFIDENRFYSYKKLNIY